MRRVEYEFLTKEQKEEALEHLSSIVESEFFRGSQRCIHFLEYSVRHVLDGRPRDELKERTLGVEVFHRSAEYDTAQDNIVRVTASEVRKRLAQYYGKAGPHKGPVVVLQSGSYAVDLRWPPEDTPADQAVRPAGESRAPGQGIIQSHRVLGMHWNRKVVGLVILLFVLLCGSAFYEFERPADVLRDVWAPVLDSPKPALLIISQPLAYRPASNHEQLTGPEDRMIALPDAFAGIGDAYALAEIAKVLSVRRKDWRLFAGNSTPSQALRDGPVILIGVHNNQWISNLMDNEHFIVGPTDVIFDRSRPGTSWSLKHLAPDWKTDEDYAIVSRDTNSETGQPVMVIAGLTNYGTRAAGEFVTDPSLLRSAMQHAPKDWQHANFEFVLHIKCLGNTPERPTVVAEHFW